MRANALMLLACLCMATAATTSAAERRPDLSRPIGADEMRLMPGDLLGKRLFEDTSLSEPPGVSCASCHDAKTAYRGNNRSAVPALAAGSRKGVLGRRKVPSLLYMAYSPPFAFVQKKNDMTGVLEIVPAGGQFWDGRAVDLQEQVEGPLLNPREMNNPSRQSVVEKIRNGPYAQLAQSFYGAGIFDDPEAFAKLASAVASYEATPRFKPFTSKFDDWLEDRVRLSEQEYLGFRLFIDPRKGNCLSCHDGGGASENYGSPADEPPRDLANLSRNPKNWLFTDFTYDVLGAPRNPRIPDNADPASYDLGLCKRPQLETFAPKDFDLESLCGAFMVPSLRNVAVTGPWMHNGYFSSLRAAVAFYFTRDTSPEIWYPRTPAGVIAKFNDLPPQYHGNVNVKQPPYDRKPGEEPRADDREIDAIVAFLETLTDRAYLGPRVPKKRHQGTE